MTCCARTTLKPAVSSESVKVPSIEREAVHIAELRSRIDSVRAGVGLAAVSWTTPVLTAGTTVVQAAHILQMRTALDEAYDAAKQSRPSYTDPALGSGTTIRAAHVTELRSAVVALE